MIPALPKIVCLCGSLKSAGAEMQRVAEAETLAGHIVLDPEVSKAQVTEEQAAALDELHLRKIDFADEVIFVIVDGYVGASTAAERVYAGQIGKPTRLHVATTMRAPVVTIGEGYAFVESSAGARHILEGDRAHALCGQNVEGMLVIGDRTHASTAICASCLSHYVLDADTLEMQFQVEG